MGLKKCTKCGNKKRSSSYCKDRKNKDGLSYWCRQCCADARKKKNDSACPFVYRLVFKDGSVYYGSSNQHPNKRKANHFSAMKLGRHDSKNVQHTFNTYGLPTFEILMLLDTIEEAIENETHLTATAHNRGTECLNVRHGNYNNTHRKLTDTEVVEIYCSKLSQCELARRYDIDQAVVSHIKNRTAYTNVTTNLGEPGRLTSRLTDEMRREILTSTESGAALARKYGCTRHAINAFRRKHR
jgi:predicted GIY-YIG superfamily endonuclease